MNQPTWEIFKHWSIPPNNKLSWTYFSRLIPSCAELLKSLKEPAQALLEKWDEKLNALGKDPSRTDYSKFRLLRLHKENDWSDMIAWLIENSQTGHFAYYLFQLENYPPVAFKQADARREISADDSRADFVINFSVAGLQNFYVQMEVKINDPGLEKTRGTAEKARKKFHNPELWHDFLLMKSENLSQWTEVLKIDPKSATIQVIFWDRVAIALRRALWLGHENVSWNVWAHTLCGAVEGKLLHLDYLALKDSVHEDFFYLLDRRIEILKEGQTDGKY